ncbi:MAG: glycosyltransferase family 2 protein [Jatrophihabitans sp.]
MSDRPQYGIVVLTQGQRPEDLDSGLRSLLGQVDVDIDVVVVGNGWQPVGLPDGVRAVGLPDNVGIPAGRNAGVPHVQGELLFFLDDDASLRDPDTLARMARIFAAAPDIGLIQPRVLATDGRPAPRRWTPRLRVGDPSRSSDITALWEGAVAMRRELFDRIGGWAAGFFYAHEGIDLAWAVWDAGARVRYAGDLVVLHPAIAPTRHAEYHELSVRNRVFLARRRLPAPLAATYLTVWAALTLARIRSREALHDSWRGAVEGFREDAGPRRPMQWRTVWRMARAGRPPLI